MQQSTKKMFKVFDASDYRVGIVMAQFNSDITEKILKSALAKLEEYGIKKQKVKVYRVSGSVEIPVVVQAMAASDKFDLAIAIGAIIKGETDHYTYVANLVTNGILEAMEDGMPVGFGVLTVNNKEQAITRLHIGAEAAEAALQAAKIVQQILK